MFCTRKIVAMSAALVLALMVVGTMPRAHAAAIEGSMVLGVGSSGQWDSALVLRPWVVYDGTSFTMWYGGEDANGADRIGMATSSDGMTWTKYSGNPVLDLGAAGGWDGDSVTDASVIKENGQYKMWYTGQQYGATPADDVYKIGYATSPDGIHWTRYSANPVVTPSALGAWDDFRVWRPSVIATGSGYVMYYRGAPAEQGGQAKAGMATSPDGIHWTKTSSLTMPAGSSGWDAYSRQVDALNIGGVMYSGSTYIMSYASLKTQTAPAEIGLASSQDGTNWTPYANNPVITYGTSGWDSGSAGVGGGSFAGSMILAVQNSYYLYYAGQDTNSVYTIGVATLPMSQYPISEYPQSLITVILAATIIASLGILRLQVKRTKNP